MLFNQQRTTVLLCSVALSAFTSFAIAGPQEDTEQAEKEFARGDLVTSMSLWRTAAEQGYAPAQVRLAAILDKAEQDVEAVEWYQKAAAQGSAAGEYGLGTMYASGEGVKKDLEKAHSFILRAAEKSYLPAIKAIMEAYRSGGLGLAADPVQAKIWKDKFDVLVGKEKADKQTDTKL
jgi:uncharacterized protein